MAAPKIGNGEVVRITRVDDCGRPVVGPDNAFVSCCFASVEWAPDIDEGEDLDFPAMGGSCAFLPACPTFRGYDITATFFEASPELIELLTGQPAYYGWDGEPIGWDDCSLQCRGGFALELWARAAGEDLCPDDIEPGVEEVSLYMLTPWIASAFLGDLTISNEAVEFTVQGHTRAPTRWGCGPWEVQAQDADNTPGPLLNPIGSDCHRRSFITTIPAPECGTDFIEVPEIFECPGSPTSPTSP